MTSQTHFPFLRYFYLIIGMIIMMCLGTVYTYSVFRLEIENHFEVGSAASGVPYMVSLAVFALFVMFSGRLLDRHHPKTFLNLGALLIGAGWLLSGLANSIFTLTLTYGVLIGAGVGLSYGVPMNIAAKWFPRRKGLAMGLVLFGFGLSPLVTAPLVKRLLDGYGLLRTYSYLGLIFGLLLPVLAVLLRYPKTGLNPVHLTVGSLDLTPKEMVRTPQFKFLYLNFIIGSMIGLMMVGMTHNIGVAFLGFDALHVTYLISLFAIFNGIGRPIMGWLTDHLTPGKAMMITYTLILLGVMSLLLTPGVHLVTFAFAFVLFWFNLGGWLAIAPASTARLFGSLHYTKNYGIIYTAYGIGALIGVSITGILMDHFDTHGPIFYFILGLCCVGLILSRCIEKRTLS